MRQCGEPVTFAHPIILEPTPDSARVSRLILLTRLLPIAPIVDPALVGLEPDQIAATPAAILDPLPGVMIAGVCRE